MTYNRRSRAKLDPAPSTVTTTASSDVTGIAVQLRRRRAASYRLPVLDSGHADPWFYDDIEPSERTADGYYAAAQHLIAAGFLPAPNIPAMRLMWRRDDEQRELVRYIAERWEVAA
jgi:hypothetical protein